MSVHSPDQVPHEEKEGVSSRRTEVFTINRHLRGNKKFIAFRPFIIQAAVLKLEKLNGGTHHDVGISVQELDAFFQTPEAALQTAQQEPGKFILGSYKRRQIAKSNANLNVSLHRNIIYRCQLHFTIRMHQMSVSYFSRKSSALQIASYSH